jgi:tetratricopeptide (TPR) repeat protein
MDHPIRQLRLAVNLAQFRQHRLIEIPLEFGKPANAALAGLANPASVWDRSLLVMSLAHQGRFLEASQAGAEAVRLAESTHNLLAISRALMGPSTLHLIKGSWRDARLAIDRFLETGVEFYRPYSVACHAWVLAQLGEADGAVECLREGEQLIERQASSGIVSGHDWCYQALGRACLALSRLDEAQRFGQRSLKAAKHFNAHALDLLGHVAIRAELLDAGAAQARFRQVLEVATRRGLGPLAASSHLDLGTLLRMTGKSGDAREHLNTAATLYREMDMPFWLQKAEAELGNSTAKGFVPVAQESGMGP